MHAVELRDQAVRAAAQLGYEVREDWFDGRGGGACLVRGRKRLFLDLAQTADEQLDVLLGAISAEPAARGLLLNGTLRERLDAYAAGASCAASDDDSALRATRG